MKKKFLYALMLFSGFSCISCSDDEKGMANIDREWMTMFICDNNRGKGDDYAYNCKAEGPNGRFGRHYSQMFRVVQMLGVHLPKTVFCY